MYFATRDEEVIFLKKLWRKEPVNCPKCKGATLEHLHKKAKKSDCDWKCPACGEVYNGPGKNVWDNAGKVQKNGQRPISLNRLSILMDSVDIKERIPVAY